MTHFIAIPYFSQAEYLREAVLSVVTQTEADWHLAVLDDSTLPTETAQAQQVCKEIQQQHPDLKIQYIRNSQNLGMARNWNQALQLGSVFERTTILHSDDRLLPHYVKSMKEASLHAPDVSVFFCKTQIIDQNGNLKFSFPDRYKDTLLPQGNFWTLEGASGIEKLIRGNFIFCPTLCFVNRKTQSIRFNESKKMVPDFELILELLLSGHQLGALYSIPLYEYRRHSQNTTQHLTQNLVRFHEERDLYLDLAEKLKQRGDSAASRRAGQMRIIKLNLIFLCAQALIRGNWVTLKRFLGFLREL